MGIHRFVLAHAVLYRSPPEFEYDFDELADAEAAAETDGEVLAACDTVAKAEIAWLGVCACDALVDGDGVWLGVGSKKTKRLVMAE